MSEMVHYILKYVYNNYETVLMEQYANNKWVNIPYQLQNTTVAGNFIELLSKQCM